MAGEAEQAQARVAIFSWLDQKMQDKPWVTWGELTKGCPTQLGLIPLASSRGIWNPRQFDETLSIMTSTSGPYSDEWIDDEVMRYSYQGSQGLAGDNTKMRLAMQKSVPIIVLQRMEPSVFVPRYPAFVTGDDTQNRLFTVDLRNSISLSPSEEQEALINKEYRDQLVRTRIHQPRFRAQVLKAYQETCAVCRLNHIELLDAAHIIPDSHPEGVAAVRNGMALCKIHHKAYDTNFLGVTPDYKIKIRRDLLSESDGPMLRYGLQEMHDMALTVPRSKSLLPDRDALAKRFSVFRDIETRFLET